MLLIVKFYCMNQERPWVSSKLGLLQLFVLAVKPPERFEVDDMKKKGWPGISISATPALKSEARILKLPGSTHHQGNAEELRLRFKWRHHGHDVL